MASGNNYEIPESGAVFTFGRSRFADNQPSHFFIRNDAIIEIACGDEHTALVCENGRLFVFGSNDYGQLGLGHTKPVSKPSCVKFLKPYHSVLIACGKGHTLVATSCGRLFSFGSNSDGQLGVGDTTDRSTPTAVEGLDGKKIKAIAAGCFHSALLTDTGEVFTWGCNNDGQCGSSSNESILTPTKITLEQSILSISCGYYHTLIAGHNEVYTMGESDNGKLGRPEGVSNSEPQKINFNERVSQVKCGGSHSIVLTESGEVYGFGSNFSGQLGIGSGHVISSPTKITISKPIVQIGCGESHTAIVTEDGDLYTCGDTRHGKLCIDDLEGTSLFTPTLVPILQAYRVVRVSCGGCHTMVVATIRGDTSDTDVCQSKTASLPPLKVRKPVNENTEQITEETAAESASEMEETPDQEDVETRTVVLKIEEDQDGKSNTESSINMEEAVTSPAEDIYSEIKEIDSGTDKISSPVKEVTSSAVELGDVVVKPPSRMKKMLNAFRRHKCAQSSLKSPIADGGDNVFISDGQTVGNHEGSKACSIL